MRRASRHDSRRTSCTVTISAASLRASCTAAPSGSRPAARARSTVGMNGSIAGVIASNR
jgi:hypothetical protein